MTTFSVSSVFLIYLPSHFFFAISIFPANEQLIFGEGNIKFAKVVFCFASVTKAAFSFLKLYVSAGLSFSLSLDLCLCL